jgi:hypothetical protein
MWSQVIGGDCLFPSLICASIRAQGELISFYTAIWSIVCWDARQHVQFPRTLCDVQCHNVVENKSKRTKTPATKEQKYDVLWKIGTTTELRYLQHSPWGHFCHSLWSLCRAPDNRTSAKMQFASFSESLHRRINYTSLVQLSPTVLNTQVPSHWPPLWSIGQSSWLQI